MEKNHELVGKAKAYVTEFIAREFSEAYSYHNLDHTLQVYHQADRLASDAGISEGDKEQLLLAALFHDTGYAQNPLNHEEVSVDIASGFLRSAEYPESKIKKIGEIILATKMGWNGTGILEAMISDADLSGLASEDYNIHADKLKQEKSAILGHSVSKKKWRKENLSFLKNHRYKTEVGRTLYNPGKLENIKKLEIEDQKKKPKKSPSLLTIGSSKSAQTQLKTSLRNHIDLSAIADNKANIMLSLNAIVITVGLPIMFGMVSENKYIIIPNLILALSAIVSMVLATLSTRPAYMKGKTTIQDIDSKKSNLFFFGNFHAMNFEEYEAGMKRVVGTNEILDNSITRDLFFLGKSLGKKFNYLRWCYSVFMWGLICTVVSFIIVAYII